MCLHFRSSNRISAAKTTEVVLGYRVLYETILACRKALTNMRVPEEQAVCVLGRGTVLCCNFAGVLRRGFQGLPGTKDAMPDPAGASSKQSVPRTRDVKLVPRLWFIITVV